MVRVYVVGITKIPVIHHFSNFVNSAFILLALGQSQNMISAGKVVRRTANRKRWLMGVIAHGGQSSRILITRLWHSRAWWHFANFKLPTLHRSKYSAVQQTAVVTLYNESLDFQLGSVTNRPFPFFISINLLSSK
jgi:hypothetical protein